MKRHREQQSSGLSDVKASPGRSPYVRSVSGRMYASQPLSGLGETQSGLGDSTSGLGEGLGEGLAEVLGEALRPGLTPAVATSVGATMLVYLARGQGKAARKGFSSRFELTTSAGNAHVR